jgi:hypothetical protein
MMRRTIVLFVIGSTAVMALGDALAAAEASPAADPSPPAASAKAAPAAPGSATAPDDRVGTLEKLIKEMQAQYEARIAALEREVAALKGAPAAGAPGAPATEAAPAPPPPAVAEAPSAAPPPLAAAPSQTSNYFNPSISAIGNFLGVAGSNHTEDLPAASLRESEVSLQAIVDPYMRADFFLSFGEEGVGVEEGFATFTSLPWGLLAKVGRMRTSFGKINTLHLHVLPWPDEPLTTVNLLGGEEGWIGTGLSVGKLIPMGDVYSELTLQLFDGEAGELFSSPGSRDLSYNGHYRIFSDLSESTNLDVGLSYGAGPNGLTETSDTRLEGIDTTFRWKPLRTATYRSASVRGEYIRSRKAGELDGTVNATGWFLSAEYQLAKRWFVGARYEWAENADDPTLHDDGVAALLTFWPSEFSQLRGELRRRNYSNGETADEILMQLQFAIGAHGAHPF